MTLQKDILATTPREDEAEPLPPDVASSVMGLSTLLLRRFPFPFESFSAAALPLLLLGRVPSSTSSTLSSRSPTTSTPLFGRGTTIEEVSSERWEEMSSPA